MGRVNHAQVEEQMMFAQAILVLSCAAVSHAFSPPASSGIAPSGVRRHEATISMNAPLNRRSALSTAAAALIALPQLANADGAVSQATVNKAIGVYGGRILKLEKAVAAGDTAAVLAEKNAFILYASSGYANNKPLKKEIEPIAARVVASAKAGDAAATKTAYAELLKEGKFFKPGKKGAVDYSQVYDLSQMRNLGSPTTDFMPQQYLNY